MLDFKDNVECYIKDLEYHQQLTNLQEQQINKFHKDFLNFYQNIVHLKKKQKKKKLF